MAKLNQLAHWNWFQGICYTAKIGKFDQHDTLDQFIDDSANLPFGKVRRWNIFQCRNDIKQFHRILQSQSR